MINSLHLGQLGRNARHSCCETIGGSETVVTTATLSVFVEIYVNVEILGGRVLGIFVYSLLAGG